MSHTLYDRLMPEFVAKYNNRKIHGRLSVLTDVDKKIIYGVPLNLEHIDFIATLTQPSSYSRFVPSHIQLDTDLFGRNEVVGLLTGVSGLETAFNVRHELRDLKRAHNLVWDYIKKGNIPRGKIVENKIVEKYVIQPPKQAQNKVA